MSDFYVLIAIQFKLDGRSWAPAAAAAQGTLIDTEKACALFSPRFLFFFFHCTSVCALINFTQIIRTNKKGNSHVINIETDYTRDVLVVVVAAVAH